MMVVNKTTDTKISNFHSKTDYPVEKEDHLCGTSFSEGNSFLDSYQNQNDWPKIKTMEEIKAEILKAATSGALGLDPVQQIILVMGPNNNLWMQHGHSMRIQKCKIDKILDNAGYEEIQCSNGTSTYQIKSDISAISENSENRSKISFNFRESDLSVPLVHFHMAVKTSFR